jgi:hypothetical protein
MSYMVCSSRIVTLQLDDVLNKTLTCVHVPASAVVYSQGRNTRYELHYFQGRLKCIILPKYLRTLGSIYSHCSKCLELYINIVSVEITNKMQPCNRIY